MLNLPKKSKNTNAFYLVFTMNTENGSTFLFCDSPVNIFVLLPKVFIQISVKDWIDAGVAETAQVQKRISHRLVALYVRSEEVRTNLTTDERITIDKVYHV